MEPNYDLLLNLVGACACVAFAAVLITGILILARRRKQKANAPISAPATPVQPAGYSNARRLTSDDKFDAVEISELSAKQVTAQSPLPGNAPAAEHINVTALLPVLEDAYLPVHNPALIEKVNRELDAMAARGAVGVEILLRRLHQGFEISGREILVGFTGDMAWNEWKKKEAIVRALGRAKNPAAVKDLGRLLVSTCSIGMFYDLVIPAIIDALADTDGEEALDFLQQAAVSETLDPGNLQYLKHKLEAVDSQPADMEERDENGRTALHRAAYDGKTEEVEQLIAQGARVDARDKDDKTPLFLAAGDGHLDICKLLLQHGADIEAIGCVFTDRRYYYPPLMNAIEKKHRDVIKYLLESGANPNVKNEPLKSSALHRAAESGLQDIVELLIEKGAEVNPRSWTGKTPYTRALDMNHSDIAEYIKQHGGTA